MKFVFSCLGVVLLSSIVWADPQVGDYAIYDATYETSSLKSEPTKVVLKIVDYDSESKVYTLSIQFGSYSPVTEKQTLEKMQPHGTSQNVLTNCLRLNGAYGSVTVPAGTFRTCLVSEKAGDRWYAGESPVEVKAVYHDSSDGTATLSLREHHWHF